MDNIEGLGIMNLSWDDFSKHSVGKNIPKKVIDIAKGIEQMEITLGEVNKELQPRVSVDVINIQERKKEATTYGYKTTYEIRYSCYWQRDVAEQEQNDSINAYLDSVREALAAVPATGDQINLTHVPAANLILVNFK